MKICKECRWYSGEYECRSPKSNRNRVTGGFVYTPQEHRNVPPLFDWLTGMCGYRGRFWEKKQDEKIRIVPS